jgi:hypothetical protein
MGHMGVKRLGLSVDGIPDVQDIPFSCDICAVSNIKRSPFPTNSLRRAGRVNERVHMDICGPLETGISNSIYFLLLIDDYSRYSSVYFLSSRDQALKFFDIYRKAAEKIHGSPITFLRCDNAPEFVSGEFAEYTKQNGITLETTVPDSPPQNGVAERHNYTYCSMARAMLMDAGLSRFFWPLAIQQAVHVRNRLPHKALPQAVTPYERWFKARPNISYFRPFGAHCTARILSDHQKKLDPRGESGRFVGYSRNAKGYLFWHSASRTVKTRRDLVFHGPPSPTIRDGGLDYKPFSKLWGVSPIFDYLDAQDYDDRVPYTSKEDGSGPSNQCVNRNIDHKLESLSGFRSAQQNTDSPMNDLHKEDDKRSSGM